MKYGLHQAPRVAYVRREKHPSQRFAKHYSVFTIQITDCVRLPGRSVSRDRVVLSFCGLLPFHCEQCE